MIRESPLFEADVYFVHNDLSYWAGLDACVSGDAMEEALARGRDGRDVWIITTYIWLKSRGLNVHLVDRFVPNEICIAHSDDIDTGRSLSECFIVGVRADRERQFLCDIEVVQSPASIESDNAFLMQNWPQPGLVPRLEERGNNIRTLGFVGRSKNLAAAFRSVRFKDQLSELGMELIIREQRAMWWDYRDIDVVIAIRDGSARFLASKPAAKLINSWLAGCPALVGQEPAFSHLKQSELDYIPITDTYQAINALQMLKDHPERYQAFRLQAETRAREFTSASNADRWEALFRAEIVPRYLTWSKSSGLTSSMRRNMKNRWRIFRRALRGYRYTRGYDIDGNPISRQHSWRRRLAWVGDDIVTSIERRRLGVIPDD